MPFLLFPVHSCHFGNIPLYLFSDETWVLPAEMTSKGHSRSSKVT